MFYLPSSKTPLDLLREQMTESHMSPDPSDVSSEVGAGVGSDAGHRTDTRQRILDVALDLFTDQGYDGTSLREIAEKLGITKAALYYYFESKEDILLALHMRLHEFGKESLQQLGAQPVTLEMWSELLDELIDQMLPQRKILLLHQRNEAALEKIHNRDHAAENEFIFNRLRTVMSDPNVPLEDRVRMAASVGVIFSGFFLAGEAFVGITDEELGTLLRQVLYDVLDR